MRRRRMLAAGLFSVLMAAILAVVVYTEHISANATVSVWLLDHDVPAGAQYSASDVSQLQVRGPSANFSYETLGPQQFPARYARSLSRGDIIRSDDLVPLGAAVEVALAVQNPPPINAGDSIDVYAALSTGQQALIGRGLTVLDANAGELDVLVPAADEAAWVAIGSSTVPLHAVRITGTSSSQPAPLDVGSAVRILCGPACAVPVSPAASP